MLNAKSWNKRTDENKLPALCNFNYENSFEFVVLVSVLCFIGSEFPQRLNYFFLKKKIKKNVKNECKLVFRIEIRPLRKYVK